VKGKIDFCVYFIEEAEMNEKEKSTDILNNINNQFKELIDLIEKEKDFSFSIKSFEKKKKSKKKFYFLLLLLLLSISIYFILSNHELTYNIYFVFLSFIRLILIQVRRILIKQSIVYFFLKILPYWDWTKIYTNPCLITNPFYNNSLDLSECNVNEN